MQQHGFTLIEIVVTTALVGLIVISVANLFIMAGNMQRESQRLEMATRTGEKKIESLRNNHYNSLEAGTTRDFTGELPPELDTPRTATVDITEPEPGLRKLDVDITYTSGSDQERVDLTTVIGNVGISQ